MSMISGQCDKLRELAIRANGLYEYEMERELDQAADTIWQLRDDLQRANAAVQDAEHDESMAWDRVRKAEAENAKLRELVRIAVKHCDSGTCDGCPILGEDESCPYSDMARELGVEVKDD